MNIRFVVVAVLLISYLFSSPYITANNMLRAAKNHDAKTLIRYINFPAVRASVKDQLQKLLSIKMPRELQKVILLSINKPTPKLLTVEAMIDLVITADSLEALLANMKNNKAGLDGLLDKISMGWHGFGEFTVTVERRHEVKFILSREHLVFWKMTAAILPVKQIYLQRAI